MAVAPTGLGNPRRQRFQKGGSQRQLTLGLIQLISARQSNNDCKSELMRSRSTLQKGDDIEQTRDKEQGGHVSSLKESPTNSEGSTPTKSTQGSIISMTAAGSVVQV